jgi:Ca-activated chloride channel family protein
MMPTLASTMFVAATVVYFGCAGQGSYDKKDQKVGGASQAVRREGTASAPVDGLRPSTETWSPIGSGQNSLGLGETLAGPRTREEAYAREMQDAPKYLGGYTLREPAPSVSRGTASSGVVVDQTRPEDGEFDDFSHGFSQPRSRRPALDAETPAEDVQYHRNRMMLDASDETPAEREARYREIEHLARDAQFGRFTIRSSPEIWVIERARGHGRPSPIDDGPGCGSLVTTLPDRQQVVPVPLEHTEVNAAIEGFISSVTVTQQFRNPYSGKIEAVYVFPLPENAAVSEFLMTVGDRTIRGIVRERGEAERVYQQARAQGYVASLMTQERPNIFTQRVANIEPGKSIDVNVTYYSTLTFADGAYEFVFPMVVGPRFNPPSGNGTGVGAVGVGSAPGSSGQATEVSYLRPDMRSGHDIGINVDIDAWVDIERIECATHAVEVSNRSGSRAHVRLLPSDSVPNRDFVLRTVVAGDQVKSRLITHRDERGGFFSLMLVPPRDLKYTRRGPVEMVYVLDCSGSMSGRPMEQAKAAVERGLSRLEPMDTFQIIDFAESASRLGTRPLAATPDNVRQAREYLASLGAGGGTMMMTGLKASLGFPHDPERLRYVAFLTDGYIGNEQEILTCQAREQRDSRVFSFGVGTSVNRALMDSMARVGRGVTAYVAAGDSPTEVMDLFHDRVSAAALCDINVEWGSAGVKDVFPSRTPDLFVGRPVILTGRFEGDFSGEIVVNGRAGGERRTLRIKPEAGGIFGMRTPALPTSGVRAASAGGNGSVDVTPPAYGIRTVSDPRPSSDHARPGEWSHEGGRPRVAPVARGMNPLPQVWARMKLADLADRSVFDPGAWIGPEMEETALKFSLLSARTAFVAVDSMTRTDGSYGTTVNVPVPVPQGVRYETTVTEK